MTARIDTETDLATGFAALSRRDPAFAAIAHLTPPLRRRTAGFATLFQAIVGQQVSTASAAAIWARLEMAGLADPAALRAAGEEGLRAAGLSRPKIRYALALADAAPDLDALNALSDEAAVRELTQLPGIGRWTAEIYLLTALGRPDVLPAGDLALQEAARILYHLEDRPQERAFRRMGEAWSPWRAVAARYLWELYGAEKKREGMQ
ncbi:probable 3-methyladenine DNA glycosylase/8-oxoguanine DNA glycosylase [Pseudooceanicola batsensis HTCC2597]|uniref:DNA-3-methyladenine glycosylase II n=1 Tax=Pseudooceanicola batsensis (strain ATCC BAA-863 / DSM 15984 / KCTC 12145 / HTCC2597) TaxID=252305 RepID=A3U2R9_PSEBH|nr:DNA-3-methyladenine glycosylase [Pseudooceanicola batsensis]EAQ01449.1 probable 3-methyladenine DNA glycosylase/8-oxoguanine DNA glycosylase [Pseudooceanicola batsensis HTCC2597]